MNDLNSLNERLANARATYDAVIFELQASRVESRRVRSGYRAAAYIGTRFINDAKLRLAAVEQHWRQVKTLPQDSGAIAGVQAVPQS